METYPDGRRPIMEIRKQPGIATLAVAATAVSVLATPSLPALADMTATNGRIVYSRPLPDGGSLAFTANPDGTHEQLVPTPFPNEDFGRAVWSHDGSQLLLSNMPVEENGEVVAFRPAIVEPDGSSFRLLELPGVQSGMSCGAWSPNDSRILCGLDQNGLWSIRSDGGDALQLTHGLDGPVGYSPDGTRIAFLRFKSGHAPGRAEFLDEKVALFVMDSEGTNIRQLTAFGLLVPHETAGAGWAPDGRSLISATFSGQLVSVPLDGSGAKPTDLDLGKADYFAFAPDYAPDGTRIIFTLIRSGDRDIYTANPDGSEVAQVTGPGAVEQYPDWGQAPVS